MPDPKNAHFLTLEKKLEYRFKDISLLVKALTHVSALDDSFPSQKRFKKKSQKDHPLLKKSQNYERLEFLGDRVLGLVIAAMVIDAFPQASEGELAQRFNRLVRRETCADVAKDLQLDRLMFLGQSALQAGEQNNITLQADICESLLGALFLDGGFDVAQRVIQKYWHARMLDVTGPLNDAKTYLQEWAQQAGKPIPVYTLEKQIGSDHAPTFLISVHVKGIAPSFGKAHSKRGAQQSAAEALLYREGIWKKIKS